MAEDFIGCPHLLQLRHIYVIILSDFKQSVKKHYYRGENGSNRLDHQWFKLEHDEAAALTVLYVKI